MSKMKDLEASTRSVAHLADVREGLQMKSHSPSCPMICSLSPCCQHLEQTKEPK